MTNKGHKFSIVKAVKNIEGDVRDVFWALLFFGGALFKGIEGEEYIVNLYSF